MSEFRRNLLTAMNKAEPPITKDYLTIVALEDGLTAKLSVNACEYCVDGNGNWKTLPADTETETINAGHTLSFRGNLTPTSSNGIGTFTVNKYFNLKGNCMSLLFGDEGKVHFSLEGKNYVFIKLFYNNTKLLDASKFVLPAITLSSNCYVNMFGNCSSLIAAPQLPTTTLAEGCYGRMFQNCISLTTAPDLLATTLIWKSYAYMFNGCSKLNYIKMLAINISVNADQWVDGVASSGTFVKNKDAKWNDVGVSGIPKGWTVITE